MNTPTSSARTTSTSAVVSLISGIVSGWHFHGGRHRGVITGTWAAARSGAAAVRWMATGWHRRSSSRYLQLTLVVLGVIALFVFFGGLASCQPRPVIRRGWSAAAGVDSANVPT